MKTKKVCGVLAIALALVSQQAMAAGITVNQNGTNVQVRGDLPLEYGTEQVDIVMLEKGVPITQKEDIIFADIQKSNGTFLFDFNLNGETKYYTVYVSSESAVAPLEKTFLYASTANLEAAVAIVNAAASASAMKTALAQVVPGTEYKVYELMGIDVSAAEQLKDDTNVYQYVVDNLPYTAVEAARAAQAFQVGAVVQQIAEEPSAEAVMKLVNDNDSLLQLKETQTENGKMIDKILTAYVNGEVHVGEKLINARFDDIDALKKAYQQAVILAACQYPVSGRYDVESTLKEAQNIIGIQSTWAGYQRLSDTAKVSAITAVQGKNYATLTELATAFTNAVNTYAKNPGSGSNPTGGNGGGSSNGGSGVWDIGIGTTTPEPNKTSEGFTDLASAAWAKEAIETLAAKGIVSGRGDGTFAPNETIKREEFVKMIVAALEIPLGDAGVRFGDAAENAWYNPYINAAAAAGVVAGVGNNNFGIGYNITREDLVTICYRAAGADAFAPADGVVFTDEADFSEYAREGAKAFNASGIVKGYEGNVFLPKNTATRAEAAKIIYEFLRYMDNN